MVISERPAWRLCIKVKAINSKDIFIQRSILSAGDIRNTTRNEHVLGTFFTGFYNSCGDLVEKWVTHPIIHQRLNVTRGISAVYIVKCVVGIKQNLGTLSRDSQ